MMQNDSHQILDDLLSRWHFHCKTYKEHARSADPTFRHSLRAKGEQTLVAITEDQLEAGQMLGVEFAVSGDQKGHGAMPEPYRTAIYINARNCYTGHSVWISPRLPSDAEKRAELVATARAMLMERLFRAGIM
jgi:hypothetical protein